MSRLCMIVADGRRARLFEAQPVDAPRSKMTLVERAVLDNPDLRDLGVSVTGRPRTETNTNRQAGPVHPIGAQRERHRLELDRRFAREIAARTAQIADAWKDGTVVLVAEPHLLGLVREGMRSALHPGIELKELAKDYARLTPDELHERLVQNRLLPAGPNGS